MRSWISRGLPSRRDAPVVHDRHAPAQPLGLFDVVGREQHRAVLRAQFGDERVDLAPHLRVQPGRRLVEEDEARLVDERQGDGEPLFLAAGKGAVEIVLFPQEVHPGEQRVDLHGLGIQPGKEAHRLADADAVGQVGILQADADAVLERGSLPGRVEPEHAGLAARARADAFEDFDGGRLARAVGSEQAENLAFGDGEVDPLHRLIFPIGFLQPADFDGKVWHRGSERMAPAAPAARPKNGTRRPDPGSG